MPRVTVTLPTGTFSAETCEPCVTDEGVSAAQLVAAGQIVNPGAWWEGIIIQEGIPTGDGRMMERGAIRWEKASLPLPLRWAAADVGGHGGAEVVGRIEQLWRDGDNIMGRGVFDAGSEVGREAQRQMVEKLTTGVSADLDDVDLEVRVAQDVLDAAEAEMDAMMAGEPLEREVPDPDEQGRVTVVKFAADDEMQVVTDARIRAATMVATPAFARARLALAADQDATAKPGTDAVAASALVAAAATAPPAGWFTDQSLPGPTPLTVTDDGQVYGHIATWGTCHTAFSHECITPPRSASAYAYFRTGAIRCDDHTDVAVGRLTVDTRHAGRRLGPADTAGHYEHTGLAVADVAAGEDTHGIWVAGAVRAGVTDEQVAVLRASPISGDWRRIGGSLELVAALAVNSPGFPVPRALVAGGHLTTVQSAGVLDPATVPPGPSDADQTDRSTLLGRMLHAQATAEADRQRAATGARTRVLIASATAKMGR